MEFLAQYYLWFKAVHLIFVISWMAGMLYLPRLFVYHSQTEIGSEEDKRFQTMERKLMRIIMNPAMIITFFLGFLLADIADVWMDKWFHIKGLLLIFMVICHIFFSRWRKAFARGCYPYNERFFRIINEVPTVLMFGIVILAVVKPL